MVLATGLPVLQQLCVSLLVYLAPVRPSCCNDRSPGRRQAACRDSMPYALLKLTEVDAAHVLASTRLNYHESGAKSAQCTADAFEDL